MTPEVAEAIRIADKYLPFATGAPQPFVREFALESFAYTAAVGQVTKLKNRVGHGVCPCCNRSFGNLARHIESEHPTFIAEAAE